MSADVKACLNGALVMALEFYADRDQYGVIGEQQTRPMILADHGKRAQHALRNAGKRALDVHHQLETNNRTVAAQRRQLARSEEVIAALRVKEAWLLGRLERLESDNAALAGRAEKAEIVLAKLYEYTERVEARYAPMLASRSYLPGFPDGAEELGDEVRAVLAAAPPRGAGEGE